MPWETVTCEVDNGPAHRAAIGLIALASDTVSEPEARAFLPTEGIGLYVSRVPMPDTATVESLGQMQGNLQNAAAMLVPDDHLDVVAYGCTAGATLIGSDNIACMVNAARKKPVAYTDPILAGVAALRALECRRIALLTPYVDEVGDVVAEHFASQGFEIVAKASFKKLGDPDIARVSPLSIYKEAVALGSHPQVDGVFISCTALRVSGVIEAIERDLGKPVASSNQSLAWQCLRLSGYHDALEGRGRLFKR
jgi:maleate isomerase